LIAGGFGKLKGKMFRVGSMGDIDGRLVSATVNAIGESLKVLGHVCNTSTALDSAWKALGSLA
jgi:aspartate aminotransferase-like enzyme